MIRALTATVAAGGAQAPWGRWRSLGASLLLTLFPAQCGACAASMPADTAYRLCDACLHTLLANDGHRCRRCDVETTHDLCTACQQRPRAFAALRAPWQYGGAMRDLIVASKFHDREDLAAALAALIAPDRGARALAEQAHVLVPIPLGGQRRRSRGYNPSAILARALGRVWQRPVQPVLRRVRDTVPQSALKLANRRLNMREAFAPRIAVTGTALLIDDVVTSGETVHDAARALLAAGATRVVVVAAARAIA